MKTQKNNLHLMNFHDSRIHGGFILRSPGAPENGNTALHVCHNPDDVMACRQMLADQTLDLEHWVLAGQKHTDRAQRVSVADQKKGAFDHESAIPDCDALYTTDPDTLIGVFTADCLGILLYDPTIPVIAAVHSGWKGTAKAILYKTLAQLQKEGLLFPRTMQVRFSPSLMVNSLEVGPEVVEQIEAMAQTYDLPLDGCILPGQGDRSYLDNQMVNARMLEAFGIPKENIHLSDLDTKTNPDCFSYRRDGRLGGEHFSYIYMEKPE